MHNGFQSSNLNLIAQYDGIEDVLKAFTESGISIAAVSSRKRESLEESLTHSGIIHYFDTIIGPYDTPHHKPHPAPALLALERLSAQPAEAIMIGDSYIDIETGKNAGTQTMRVTYGFNQEKIHEPKPDYIAHAPKEILQCIKNR
jgi:pyrophosphatase PpaX